ncbi:MAG: M61 family metallopeptidase [Candidatus Aminicenantales bacterium]
MRIFRPDLRLTLIALSMTCCALGAHASSPTRYVVTVSQLSPPKLSVTATLPIKGNALEMDTTRPGDVPEVLKGGWPALIRHLTVADDSRCPIEVTEAGPSGWQMKEPRIGTLTVTYEVDYSNPATLGWPAPREAVFADPQHLVFVGRSAFITTPEVRSSIITFALPPGWRAVTPWAPAGRSGTEFTVDTVADLVENLIVLSRPEPEVVTAGGFRVFFTPLGHWQPAAPEIRRVLGGVIPRFVALMDFKERSRYSIVLLPVLDRGGEAYRGSFAFTVDDPPSRTNMASWGQTIAHELFHYWNGERLRGADYASSQWFQEGFTEYAADLAMVGSGLVGPDGFLEQLAKHIRDYRKLATALDSPGGHKGPPLYGGGALVAFCWDIQIRRSSGGQKDIGDFLRALWRQTDGGRRAYEWEDIRASLAVTAPLDWTAFYAAHIKGTEKLPLEEMFSQAGLRLVELADGSPRVERDPHASSSAKSLWDSIVGRISLRISS